MPNGDHGPSWADEHYEQVRNALRRLLVAFRVAKADVIFPATLERVYLKAAMEYARSALPGDAKEPLSDETIKSMSRQSQRQRVREQVEDQEKALADLRRQLENLGD